MPLLMDLRIEDKSWQTLGDLEALCQRALEAGFAGNTGKGLVDVLLTDDTHMETLNTQWRAKPKPTDVLSFPATTNPEGFLGDIVIGYGIAQKDAQTSGKTLSNHLSHLLIHGLLHLLGHDHIQDNEAEIMENLERKALASLGIDDPYSRIAEN